MFGKTWTSSAIDDKLKTLSDESVKEQMKGKEVENDEALLKEGDTTTQAAAIQDANEMAEVREGDEDEQQAKSPVFLSNSQAEALPFAEAQQSTEEDVVKACSVTFRKGPSN